MSNVGDALSGSSGGSDPLSGVNNQTFADATLGDQIQGGTGDFTGGDISASDAGGGGFQTFSNLTNALSGAGGDGAGASPAAAQAASMTPPSAAAATGGDPVGAASGTQSSTTPGSTPTGQNQQQQTQPNQQNQNDQQYAPKSATDQLKALLKQLSGKPPGPTGPVPQGGQNAPFALPTLAAGQTGAQSTGQALNPANQVGLDAAASMATGLPAGDAPEFDPATGTWGGSTPAAASIPPGAAQQPAAQAERTNADGTPAVDAQGNPVTAAGTPAADTPLPPPRPGDQTADAGQGGNINVHKRGPPLPTRVPLPTHKPGPDEEAPPTGAGATPRILQDISGASTGSPTALADLAQAARILLPLAGMLLAGGGRRGGVRFGRFHGGRFTHGVGGFRGGGFHPGAHGHPAWRGAWPYHHPMHGWDMHHHHPGGGWLPLNPAELGGMGGGGIPGGDTGVSNAGMNAPNRQGGRDPNNPPQEAGDGQPDAVYQKSGYNQNPFIDALVKQESGGGQNIISRTDMDSQGRTLAQGGNPNEISQGYFQIQNHPGGTWDTYARQAGVDLNKYPTPRSAPLAVQWQVAQRIPIGQWGAATKAILRQKFGQFDPNMPFGQVASRFNRAGSSLADRTPSRTQPAWASGPASASLQLPVTSQPQVAGGP
jgi:hypothetical protein